MLTVYVTLSSQWMHRVRRRCAVKVSVQKLWHVSCLSILWSCLTFDCKTALRITFELQVSFGFLALFAFFSERERDMSSQVRLSVVCRLSVTFVHHTQAIEIFGNFSSHLVRWPSADIQVKFYGDRLRGTPPSGELNTRGVAEYSDFGPIERSRKRCNIAAKLVLITNRKSHMSFDWYQIRWPWMTLNGVIALTAA